MKLVVLDEYGELFEMSELYVVATPIGNLGDISQRALDVLQRVDMIAAEDTRHSRKLLSHFHIDTPLCSYHRHNERSRTESLITQLAAGKSIALISDAGTPLISDPGSFLISAAMARQFKVIPIPGPSAFVAALSVSGLSSEKFAFEGFLPAKASARRRELQQLKDETRTLIFYEAPHRILDTITDMGEIMGGQRRAVIAREITKTYETLHADCLENIRDWIQADENQRRGEIVILVQGADLQQLSEGLDREEVLKILLAELPLKQAAGLAARITGGKKNELYARALELNKMRE